MRTARYVVSAVALAAALLATTPSYAQPSGQDVATAQGSSTRASGSCKPKPGHQLSDPSGASHAAPVTSMTSSSVVHGTKPIKPGGSRVLLTIAILGVVSVGGIVGLVVARGGSTDPAAGASLVGSTPSVAAASPGSAAGPVSPEASASAAAFDAVVLPTSATGSGKARGIPAAGTRPAVRPAANPTGATAAARHPRCRQDVGS